MSNQTYTGQINYNIPFGFGGRTPDAAGGWCGRERFASHTDFTMPSAADSAHADRRRRARFDGIVQFVENPTRGDVRLSLVPGVNRPRALVERRARRRTQLPVQQCAGAAATAAARASDHAAAAGPHRADAAAGARRAASAASAGTEPRLIAAVERATAARSHAVFRLTRPTCAPIRYRCSTPSCRLSRESQRPHSHRGNADERGSDEYNQALGMRRAQIARKYLIDHGIDAGRIDISSNGEEKPVCQAHDESCWSQNRRDEFVIVAGAIVR